MDQLDRGKISGFESA